jgi:hypothetical protein
MYTRVHKTDMLTQTLTLDTMVNDSESTTRSLNVPVYT